MTTTTDSNTANLDARRFPFVTVIGAAIALFIFMVIVLVVYRSPNYLGRLRSEPSADTPMEKQTEARSRNLLVLAGQDPSVKMSNAKATFESLETVKKTKKSKNELGHLPFPVEPRTKEEKSP